MASVETDDADKWQLATVSSIDWRRYQVPEHADDIDECHRIDAYNSEAYDFNTRNLSAVNDLLIRIGVTRTNVRPPIVYRIKAIRKQEAKLFEPHARLIGSIEYLAENGKYPVKDYAIETAPTEADKLSFSIVVNRCIADGNVDITPAVGESHREECTCGNRWDGLSDKCIGGRARMRWRTGTKTMRHHFRRPIVVPESF